MKKINYLLLSLLFLLCINVNADESGASFWTPGSYAGFAAVPADPGWSLPTQVYYSHGRKSTVTQNMTVAATDDSILGMFYITPTFAPTAKLLGGVFTIAATFGVGYNWAEGGSPAENDSMFGAGDISPTATLAWNAGVNNWMTYITGNIPVGAYNVDNYSGIGLGFWAVDIGGGYTYYNENNGLEFSAVIGGTYNFENTHTDYQSGIDSHLDWEASKNFGENWQVGVAGFVYYQLTDDTESGAVLGANKSDAAGIGPELGYTFKVGGKEWSANLRGYYDFWTENRLGGLTIFLDLSIPL
jgi:hypothetical protein